MTDFFNQVFYLPIYNLLIWLYSVLGADLGLAIIVLTIIVRLLIFPLSKKQITSQKEMQELQPKIKEINEKYKDDREQKAKETMALYKEHKINPAAGCLPLIVMLVLFFAMYRVIFNLAREHSFIVVKEDLYSFVPAIDQINNMTLNFLDLGVPNYFLAIIAAIASYYQIAMMQKKSAQKESEEKVEDKKESKQPDFGQVMQKQMLVIIPAMTLFIGVIFPAGLTLYWFTSTLFLIGQQWMIMRTT